MEKLGVELIWKDRKRYLGMPLSFTRYALSEDRLFLSVGFLSIKDDEILVKIISDSIWMSSYKAPIQGSHHKRVPEDIAEKAVIIGPRFCCTGFGILPPAAASGRGCSAWAPLR